MTQMYNPDEIIRKANEMTQQSNELKTLIDQMENIVSEMRSVWQSPAQDAFKAKFDDIRPQLSSFCTNINTFAKNAIDHANAVKNAEGVV